MANTHFATSGVLSANLGEVDTTARHRVGEVVKGNNASEWVYVYSSGVIAQYALVAIEIGGTATPATHANTRAGNSLGLAQVAFATAEYGWVATEGNSLRVNTLAAEAIGVTLYTTDTAGAVADATASASAATIFGLTLVATASGTTASNAAVIARNMVVRKTIVDA